MLHIKCYVLYKLRDTLCLVYLCVYGPFRKHTIRTISIRCTIRYGLYQSEMCHTNPILVGPGQRIQLIVRISLNEA